MPRLLRYLLPLVLLVGLTGCGTFGVFGDDDDDELEITGTVEVVGDAFLTVDGVEYTVTDDTEFEGYASLADLAVGDDVEVEYEEGENGRVALEIEDPEADDD